MFEPIVESVAETIDQSTNTADIKQPKPNKRVLETVQEKPSVVFYTTEKGSIEYESYPSFIRRGRVDIVVDLTNIDATTGG